MLGRVVVIIMVVVGVAVVCVIMVVVGVGRRSGGFRGGGCVAFEFGAVGGVRVAVRSVEGVFERDAAAADKRERVSAARHDFVGGEEASHDLYGAVVGLADDDGSFVERVRQIEIFDVNEAVGGVALERGARHAHHAGAA